MATGMQPRQVTWFTPFIILKKKEKEKKKEASELIPILKTLEYFFIKLFQMTEIKLS